MSSCTRCGVDIRWTEVSIQEGGTTRVVRVPLETVASQRPPRSDLKIYRLVSEDQGRGEEITKPGVPGYANHDETCPALQR